ncbi:MULTISPECIES: gamma-mobile-trio recombinase GmtY [Aeromonas]|uniref:gamma-mobile-trio recombinase GmtY n=1 Tax=Aeromonas TaxID=642 RepID=UPI000DD04123|nr:MULTISPECIES: gamma-mobile-trio recombinase GmtY [Aeromonas]QWZ65440.1 site-specific integrase [Aeromonas sp. FDAARGOS 1417]
MEHTTIRGKVYRDHTGVVTEIPVILTEHGPLRPLVDYFLAHVQVRSSAWMTKTAQAVGLLLDYMTANQTCFDDPKVLFEVFSNRLYTGTVGENGTDPSGLYWQGRTPAVVRVLVNCISRFSDWMARGLDTKSLNPWRDATKSEEMLAWAAWHQKHNRAFLAHTWDRGQASLAMTHARNTLLKRTPVIDHEQVKRFPDEHMSDLLFKGFIVPGKQTSPRLEQRLNIRDILITLLMHYGGVRMSEPFHLYVQDVVPDPIHPDHALVRIYHPSQGAAPPDWLGANGKPTICNRLAYLNGKYGLRPRNEYALSDQLFAGWKGNALDSKSHFMYINWFPQWAGKLFWQLWVLYMAHRAQLACDHPFAFVTQNGKPYAIDSFERQHRRAVERIGLVAAKAIGTSPHGHRHAYGQTLTNVGIDPVLRKKALHHKSLESQVVYTEPDRARLVRSLEEAAVREQMGIVLPPPDPLIYGFRDVDPLGLMSGQAPKLSRKR